jgi:hypothetical protein
VRAIATRRELAEAQVDSHGRDYSRSDDGYDDMEVARSEGWTVLSGWGRDGWDLGDWPYVVLSIRRVAGAPVQGLEPAWELLSVVEGDHTVYRFTSADDREAAIDYLFVWYGIGRDYEEWGREGLNQVWTDGTLTKDTRKMLDEGTLPVPERLRGPFSWGRASTNTSNE